MQVHRERVHYDHFFGQSANQPRGGRRKQFVVRHPGILCVEMALHAELGPIFQFSFDVAARGFWLQAERMAAEINAFRASRTFWGCENDCDTPQAGRERSLRGQNRGRLSNLCVGHLEILQRREVAVNQPIRLLPIEVFDPRDGIAQFREQAILDLSAGKGHGIRHAVKRHHRVLGDK